MIVLGMTILLSGCMKYDEGPLMSLYSKGMRVSGRWYFQTVQYGSKDSTSAYTYQQLEFSYIKSMDGGVVIWNHNLRATSADDYPLQGGIWKFIADRDSFQMILYKNLMRTDSVIYQWKIKRLAYTEFWLERTIKDTVTHRWALIKYAF